MLLAVMEENEQMLDLAKAYISAEKYARKFYKYYSSILRRSGIEVQDLIQEANLAVQKTVNKYDSKPTEDLLKLSNLAVGWHLKNIRANALLSLTREDEQNKSNRLKTQDFHVAKFKFEDIITVLTQEQYDILSDVVKNRRTFQSIADEKGCSLENVRLIYNLALKKVKKYLEI